MCITAHNLKGGYSRSQTAERKEKGYGCRGRGSLLLLADCGEVEFGGKGGYRDNFGDGPKGSQAELWVSLEAWETRLHDI